MVFRARGLALALQPSAPARPRTAESGQERIRITLGPDGVDYGWAPRGGTLTTSSAAEALHRLNRAYRRPAVLSCVLGVVLAAALVTGVSLGSGPGATALFGATAVVVLGCAHRGERSEHRVALAYDIRPGAGHAYRKFTKAFTGLAAGGAVWHLRRAAPAGDGTRARLVRRRLRPRLGLPPGVRSSRRVPVLRAGPQRLYFFPDRLLVYDAQMAWAIAYPDLGIEAGERRVRDRQAATASVVHGFLVLRGPTGLNEMFECSSPPAGAAVASALAGLRRDAATAPRARHHPA